MRWALLTLFIIGCSGSSAPPESPPQPITEGAVEPPKQPIAEGPGFHCTDNLCLRTELACKTVSKEFHKPCIARPTAHCFSLHDDDNMRSWMVCLSNEPDCEKERLIAINREPDYLRFTECQLTR